MVIKQGDLLWIEFDDPGGSSPGYKHPHVVVQNNVFNASRIDTTVVRALTSVLKWATAPGNVLLDVGEGNLPQQSVVLISQVFTIDKQALGEYMGTLSRKRIQQVLAGIDLLLHPRDVE